VFGQSAGGMIVGALLAHPAAAGLFRRAISQAAACTGSLASRPAALPPRWPRCSASPRRRTGSRAASDEEFVAAQPQLAASGAGGLLGLGVLLDEPSVRTDVD